MDKANCKQAAVAIRAALLSEAGAREFTALGRKWRVRTSWKTGLPRRVAFSDDGFVLCECKPDTTWYKRGQTALSPDTVWVMKDGRIVGRLGDYGIRPRNGNYHDYDFRAFVASLIGEEMTEKRLAAIHYIHRDLLKANQPIIAHDCNCEGVMDAGVAQQVKGRWPRVYQAYKYWCVTEGSSSLALL